MVVVQEIGDETRKSYLKAEETVDNAGDVAHTEMSDNKPGVDHFNNEQYNPIKSNAMSKHALHCFGQVHVSFCKH